MDKSCGRPGKALLTLFLILTVISAGFAVRPQEAYAAPTNPSGFLLPAESYSYIDPGTVSSWSAQVICYAKNEIYARNGRKFVSTELQNYFNSQYWYVPLYEPDQFTADMLNQYETANIDMLTRRENELGTYTLDSPSYNYYAVWQYLPGGSSYGGSSSQGTSQYTVNPDTYIFSDSNSRILTGTDISGLTLQELCYAKNEIYARRGYIFSSSELSDYFRQKNWYWGTTDASTFSASVFNTCESANVMFLDQAEHSVNPNGYLLDQPGYSYACIGSYTAAPVTVKTVSHSDYYFYDSAIRYLTEAEVSGLSLQQLCYARNEIYARRGYIFQSEELRSYFGGKSWYYPTISSDYFSDSVFNSFELANIQLLKNHEYAINPNGYQLY